MMTTRLTCRQCAWESARALIGACAACLVRLSESRPASESWPDYLTPRVCADPSMGLPNSGIVFPPGVCYSLQPTSIRIYPSVADRRRLVHCFVIMNGSFALAAFPSGLPPQRQVVISSFLERCVRAPRIDNVRLSASPPPLNSDRALTGVKLPPHLPYLPHTSPRPELTRSTRCPPPPKLLLYFPKAITTGQRRSRWRDNGTLILSSHQPSPDQPPRFLRNTTLLNRVING